MSATAQVQLAVMVVKPPPPLDTFQFDKVNDGWKLVEDVGPADDEFQLQLDTFLRESESCVSGEVMLERAKAMGDLAGQFHAERILRQQAEIPEDWRPFYLIFPGTGWQDSDGNRQVPYLNWNGDRWYLNWNWLENDFNQNFRLVRLCNYLYSPAEGGSFPFR